MQEIAALKAFTKRDMFMMYSPMIRKIKSLEQVHKNMLKVYQHLYETTGSDEISSAEIALIAASMYPHMEPEMTELTKTIVETKIDDALIRETMNDIVERHFMSEIVTMGLPVVDGSKHGVMDQIEGVIEKYKDHLLIHESEDVDLSSIPLTDIIEKRAVGKLGWPLALLQEALGDLPLGHLMHVFAYSETGKTALGLTLMCHFAKQLRDTERNICYLGNEENYEITYQRAVSCFTSTPLSAMIMEPQLALEKYEFYRANGGMRIRYVDSAHHIIRVKQAIEKFKPVVVFIDQGAKVAPYGATNLSGVEVKQRIFQLYRELANKYQCTIISLGQGDQTTEGKRWLRLNQMDGSKVGIPGELDVAIGIGRDDQQSRRYLSIVKNKLTGKLKQLTCGFDYERSLYYD